MRSVAAFRARTFLSLACAVAVCLCAGTVAEAAAPPRTPESRLLDVWLDLRLLELFYPETTAETLLPNLAEVARQLNQQETPIRFGESARDARKFRVGAVMIKRHPPAETWILYTRSRSHVWKLVDDAQGRLTVVRMPAR